MKSAPSSFGSGLLTAQHLQNLKISTGNTFAKWLKQLLRGIAAATLHLRTMPLSLGRHFFSNSVVYAVSNTIICLALSIFPHAAATRQVIQIRLFSLSLFCRLGTKIKSDNNGKHRQKLVRRNHTASRQDSKNNGQNQGNNTLDSQ